MTGETEQQRDDTVADGGTESLDVSGEEMSDADGVERAQRATTIPEEKRDFLLEAVRRAPLLVLLQAKPAKPGDILEMVDMSRSTVHRAFNTLEEYDIVEKTNGEYELTSMGSILAEEMETFGARAWTAKSFNQFLNSVKINGDGIPVEHFVDAKVTRRKSRQPHSTIHRIIKLLERSDSLRMFSTVISPVYVDVGYREMMDGMEIEAIFDEKVIDIMLSEYPEKAKETIETGNFDVYSHSGLPFEMFLFDDKVGMAAHNENGNAEVLIECDDAAAIEWAENLYSKHLSKADPLMLSNLE